MARKKEGVGLDDPWLRWTDVTHEDLAVALASIKRGHDPETVRNVIEYFHERMSNGFPYDKDILYDLMAHVFAGIVAGKSADQAFGLKLERGKYEREDTTERDVTAAACMVLMIRKRTNWLDAKGYTANLLFPDGTGEKAVELAYKEYRAELEQCPDEILLEMLGPLADDPIIKSVMSG